MEASHRPQPSASVKPRSAPRGALRLLYFLFYGSVASWIPFFAVYLRQAGLSGGQIGLLAGVRPVALLLSQPLWGAIADVRGRRETLLATMMLAGLLLPGYAWPGSFWFLLAWTALLHLLANPVGALIDSLALDHLQEQPGSSFGRLRMWGAVGWAAASLLAGRVVTGRDLRLSFALGAAFMLLAWLVAWRQTRPTQRAVTLRGSWRGGRNLLRDRRLITFLVLIVLGQLGAASALTFYPVYMAELGASRQLLGLAFTLQGMSELPLYLSAATIIRRLGAGRVIALAFGASATRVFLYSAIGVPQLAAAVEAIHGLAFSLFIVASVEYVNSVVPARWRATGQSLFGAAYFGAGGMLGNALAGHLYDRVGVQSMFRINAGLALAAALLALALLRTPAPAVATEAAAED